jgi:uncharacterized protein (DUF2147 family)
MKTFTVTIVCVFSLTMLFSSNASAAAATPIGTWETVSDVTGEVASTVRLSLKDGKLVGQIASLVQKEGEDPNPLCEVCPGDQKDQPVVGLEILSGLTQDGSEWNDGLILDPENGKHYRCIIRVAEDNQTMEVRGFIGISLFGRSQVWNRQGGN